MFKEMIRNLSWTKCIPVDNQDSSNSQALGNLSYIQAVLLLRILKDGREAFIANNDLSIMLTQELQQAVEKETRL